MKKYFSIFTEELNADGERYLLFHWSNNLKGEKFETEQDCIKWLEHLKELDYYKKLNESPNFYFIPYLNFDWK